MKKKVVITGVRGFVGQNLTNTLIRNKGYLITGASRDRKNLVNLLMSNNLHDICSYNELYDDKSVQNDELKFEAYIHLAGKVIHGQQEKDEEEYFQVNFEQTKHIYNRFLKDPKAEKFIFLSTIHVLTEKPEGVIDESYEPKPFTPYGRSKFNAENYIRENTKPGKINYILRPTMIHGPGNRGNLNMLYNMINQGFPYLLGSINNCRSFTSIDNLTFIIHELLQNDIQPGLYHIADDEPTYSHDLIRLIGEITGRKARILSLPLGFLKIISRLGNHIKLPINDHRLIKLTEDFIVSNQKIKNAIGKPLPIRSKDGLEKALKSFVDS